MPSLQRRWTAAQVRELIHSDAHWPRYELLDGELLVTPSPSPRHQLAVSAMHLVLASYCEREHLGVALISPADIELAPESIMQPDVFVVPETLVPRDTEGWERVRWLHLAVEVLSSSTQREDRVRKRDFYLMNGVREYWIIDADARIIERWTPDRATPEVHRDALTWRPEGASAELRIDIRDFFVRGCRLSRTP